MKSGEDSFYKLMGANNKFTKYKNSIKAVSIEKGILHLSGEVEHWQDVVDIGHLASGITGIKGVVNDICAKGIESKFKDKTRKFKGS